MLIGHFWPDATTFLTTGFVYGQVIKLSAAFAGYRARHAPVQNAQLGDCLQHLT